MRTVRGIILLIVIVLAVQVRAWADPPPTIWDHTYLLASVNGAVRHDAGAGHGQCYLDHDTCPWPWEYTDPSGNPNFTGDCITPTPGYTQCDGTFEHLYFNFLVPGFGADIFLAAPPPAGNVPLDHATTNDLIHLYKMTGRVAMSCGPDTCVTNFAGQTVYTQKMDCYIHYKEYSVDC